MKFAFICAETEYHASFPHHPQDFRSYAHTPHPYAHKHTNTIHTTPHMPPQDHRHTLRKTQKQTGTDKTQVHKVKHTHICEFACQVERVSFLQASGTGSHLPLFSFLVMERASEVVNVSGLECFCLFFRLCDGGTFVASDKRLGVQSNIEKPLKEERQDNNCVSAWEFYTEDQRKQLMT